MYGIIHKANSADDAPQVSPPGVRKLLAPTPGSVKLAPAGVNRHIRARSLIADLERATPKAKINQAQRTAAPKFELKTNKSGLRSAQDRRNALVDNAAMQHGRIYPDACGVVLRGGLQNAEVAW